MIKRFFVITFIFVLIFQSYAFAAENFTGKRVSCGGFSFILPQDYELVEATTAGRADGKKIVVGFKTGIIRPPSGKIYATCITVKNMKDEPFLSDVLPIFRYCPEIKQSFSERDVYGTSLQSADGLAKLLLISGHPPEGENVNSFTSWYDNVYLGEYIIEAKDPQKENRVIIYFEDMATEREGRSRALTKKNYSLIKQSKQNAINILNSIKYGKGT